MISISSTSVFRTVCELCHTPPVKIKRLSRIHLDDNDLLDELKEYSKDHFIYMMSPAVLGEISGSSNLSSLMNRLKLSYINYNIREWRVSSNRLKRSKISKEKNYNKTISVLAHCKCQKTFWIIPSLDREIYPELNRKSSLRK